MPRKLNPKITPEERAKRTEQARARRAAMDPEERRARERARYQENKDRINTWRSERRKDPEVGGRLREQERSNYYKDGKGAERQRQWAVEHPDRIKEIRTASRNRHAESRRQRERGRWEEGNRKKYQQQYREANRERLQDRDRADREKRRDSINARKREWRKAHPEALREENRRRYYSSPEKAREAVRESKKRMKAKDPERFARMQSAAGHVRRARLRAAGGSFTADEVAALFQRQGKKCATCKKKISDKKGAGHYHIDHVIPLAMQGSTNYISNIQLLCPTCNTRKKAMHPDQWAQQNGLLFC